MRPLWTRALHFYRADDARGDEPRLRLPGGPDDPEPVHARSRFRSVDDPARRAVYLVRDAPGAAGGPPLGRPDEHTLLTVREFRRVPLEASGLALVVFRARPGRAASLIAALGHWSERAVSVYQPTYLLVAHSLEQPTISVLLTGVRERRALQRAQSCPFSLELVLPEVAPLLERAPERYVYCPERVEVLVAPDAV